MLTLNIERLKREVQRKARVVPLAMANELRQAIIDNSKASKDILGARLKKYSPQYEKFRKAHGLSTTPNLRDTGSMLDKAFAVNLSGVVHLTPNEADRKKAEGNQRHRKFYPENESDIKGATLKRLIRAGEKAFLIA